MSMTHLPPSAPSAAGESIDAWLADEEALIARHIRLDPLHPNPAEARLVDSGVNVWALVAYRDANILGLADIAAEYNLTEDAVRAAFAFYRRHRCAINGRLALNE